MVAAADPGRYLSFHPHPDVVLVMAALAVGYWWLTTRGPVTRRQVLWFAGGLALMSAAADWPVHDLAEHYSYAIHMAEHLTFTLLCAPMILLGLPTWAIEWLVVGRPWAGVTRFVCRPVPALALNAAVLLSSHWPAVVNLTTHNEWFHFFAHLVLFGSALALWMPIINRSPALPRLTRPAQLLYLFFQSMAPIPPTLWLVFSQTPLYKAYGPGLAYLGWSGTGDQEFAGSLMGALTPVFMWTVMTYLFFSWWADEERSSHLPRDLHWSDVEREFARGPG